MRRHPLGILLGAILLVPQLARADVIALTSVRDNTIYSELPGNSNGLGGGAGQRGLRFDSGRNNAGGIRRGLVAFDIAGNLPAGATVNSVSLILTQSVRSLPGPSDTTIGLHRLLLDWGEGASGSSQGQGAPATTGDATWTSTFFNTSFWTTPGGDFSPTASAALSVGSALDVPYTWTSPQLAADVQGWLDAPSSNFGWALLNDEVTPQSVRGFYGHEWVANPDFRPRLVIDFTPASAVVPEPSALALLGIAAAASLAAHLDFFRRGQRGRMPSS